MTPHPLPLTVDADYVVCWHGGTWRSFPQPQVAREETERHLTDEVRAYLSARPGRWIVLKEIAAVLDCSHDDLTSRLRKLVARGDVASGWVVKWGGPRRWCYQWIEKPEPPRVPHRIRPTAAGYLAMRARLQAPK